MEKAEHINKRHNVSLIMYHFVCPTKYRRLVLNDEIDNYIKVLCLDIELRYEIKFLEIGLDGDHIHFLVQGIPNLSPTQIITIIKSIIGKRVGKKLKELKLLKKLINF